MEVLVGVDTFVSRPMSGGYRHPDSEPLPTSRTGPARDCSAAAAFKVAVSLKMKSLGVIIITFRSCARATELLLTVVLQE